MRYCVQWVVLCLSLMLCAPAAWAATRYVDLVAGACTGNYSIANRNCTGADGNSYATIATGRSGLAGGDTLYLRVGTYSEGTPMSFIGVNGSVGNVITIAAYPGEAATLAPSNNTRVFIVSNSTYITFDGFVVDGLTTNTGGNRVEHVNTHDIIFKNLEIKGWQNNGLYIDNGYNITVKNNLIHDQVSPTCVSGTRWYGIYQNAGNNALIEGNRIYNNPGGGMQIYPSPTNTIVRYNKIYTNNSCATQQIGGILTGGGTSVNTIVHSNEIYNNGLTGGVTQAPCVTVFNPSTGIRVYNNTCYGNYNPIFVLNGAVNTEVKNNIDTAFVEARTSGGTNTTRSFNACTASEDCGSTSKLTIAAITDCTVSTSNFTHKASSSCIGAGTSVSTRTSANGTQDIGTYEAPLIASCAVEVATPTVVNITFSNNVAPPLLPVSGVTGITARADTISKTMSGTGTRVGDSRIDQAVTIAFIAGQAIDISIAASNLTDSALIGNLTNQPFVQTVSNFSCTNNTAGAPAHVYTQAAFKFNSLRGTEAAPLATPYATAPENSNILVRVGGSVRLRLALTCTTADCPPTGFYPRYSRNAGAYTVIPDVFATDNIAFCGTSPDPDIPTNGTSTTAQLSTAGAFVAGALVRTSNAIPTVDIALNGKTELEYCIAFDTDATAGDTYDVRLYQQDGTVLNAYTITPRMTLATERAGMGF